MLFAQLICRNTTSTICDTNYNYNQGCGVSFLEQGSYGASFNAEGGGFYIMEKNHEKGISVWFLKRCDMPFTDDHEPNIDLVLLSTPDAYFPVRDEEWPDCICDYSDHFDAHEIVFDLTFCVSTLYMFCDVTVTFCIKFAGRLGWSGVGDVLMCSKSLYLC